MVSRRQFVGLPLIAVSALVATGNVAAAPYRKTTRPKSIAVKQFGARGDGKTNDSAAIQAAIEEAARTGGADVLLSKGVYLASGLRLYSNIRLLGEGRDKTIVRETTGISYLLSVNPGREGSPDPSQNQHQIEIAGIAFEGPVVSMGFSEHRHLLNFNGVTGLWIHECAIRGFRGDGIYLGSSNFAGVERHNVSVRISQNDFDGINCDNRNGISVIDGTGVWIENNRFMRCSRHDMPGPVDIEPNGDAFLRIEDISIENNHFNDCGGSVAKITVTIGVTANIRHGIQNIRISGNIITSKQRSGTGIYINVFPVGCCAEDANQPFASAVRITRNQIGHGYSHIRGISNFEISGNRFTGKGSPLILGAIESNRETYARQGVVHDNIFDGQFGKHGALTVGRAEDVVISNNRFLAAKATMSSSAIFFFQENNRPLCQGVTLSENIFSDNYAAHIVSRALATSDLIAPLESNRTVSGKRIKTVGFNAH